MKKIKEVRLKEIFNTGVMKVDIDTPLVYDKDEWRLYKNGKFVESYSEEKILANAGTEGTQTFQVEFEDENFGIEVPNVLILKEGYCITAFNYGICANKYLDDDLEKAYLSGNWFATKQEAEAEAKRREIKFALNKLRDEANEKFFYQGTRDATVPILTKEYGSKELKIVPYMNIHYMNCIFDFNNYDSYNYFMDNLNQSPELKAGLIELLERGEL